MKLALGLAALVALAGCAVHPNIDGRDWTRPDTLLQDITLDEVDCARQADAAGDTPDLVLGGLLDVARLAVEDRQRRQAFGRCMADRGYVATGS